MNQLQLTTTFNFRFTFFWKTLDNFESESEYVKNSTCQIHKISGAAIMPRTPQAQICAQIHCKSTTTARNNIFLVQIYFDVACSFVYLFWTNLRHIPLNLLFFLFLDKSRPYTGSTYFPTYFLPPI